VVLPGVAAAQFARWFTTWLALWFAFFLVENAERRGWKKAASTSRGMESGKLGLGTLKAEETGEILYRIAF
jgi:hypothetical protein